MEALGGGSSVIAVIQLTGSIATICGGYINKVKNATKEISDLKEKIISLGGVLETLDGLLRTPQGSKLATSRKLHDDVTNCSSNLEILKDKIDPKSTQSSMRKWGLRALKWPLKRTEVVDAIKDIENYKSLFTLALQVDQMISISHIEQKLDLGRLQVAKAAAFDSYENQHDECLPGTRIELIQEIEEWITSPHGKCIFWLNGMAGTGKSTISRTIARRQKERRSLGASFFFKRGEEDRGNAKKLFPTLIEQLVARVPQLVPGVQKSIDEDTNISERVLREQFEKLLLQPLFGIQDPTGTIVIVIDALDECEREDDIKVILQLLPQVQKSKSLQLRFLLTSRPELPLRLGFKGIINDHQDLILHEIPKPVIERDISLFLEYRLSEIRQESLDKGCELAPDWPGDDHFTTLVTMSVPLFIFAATVCRIFKDPQWHPADSLKEILSHENDNSHLDGTYLPVLNRLLINQNGAKKRKLIEEYQKVIGTIVILETPLPLISLSKLVGIPKESIRIRLDSLHSVLSIPDDESKPVRPFHLSFRDFLLDLDTRDKTPLWIDEKEMHKNLSIQCLKVMQHSLRKNICNLSDDTTLREDIDISSINYHLPAELQYACRYWTAHLVRSQDPVTELVKGFSFLEEHFLHWVEAMCLLGFISEVIGVIKRLQSIIQDDEHLRISEFLHDARRFILKNRQMADTAPLQLYSSGLIFAPTNSIIGRIFKKETPTWLCQWPKLRESWSAELQTLEGHSDVVQFVTFSPDGLLLVSSSFDNTIKLWDAITGELRQTLNGHSDAVYSVTFLSNGLLASASSDNTVRLWNATTGELQQTLEGYSDSVWSVTFSSDGLLATASSSNTIELWDVITGELQQTLEGHSGAVKCLAFSPNGLLASGSKDNTIKLWDIITGELQQTLEGHSGAVECLAFSPNGLLASGSEDITIKLWDITTGKLQQTLEGHFNLVTSINFSPNGLLASSSSDSTIKVWDAITGELQYTLEGHFSGIESVTFSPNGQLLASASIDNTIKLWDITTGKLQQAPEDYSEWVDSVTFSSNGQLLASVSSDGIISLWHAITGELQQTLDFEGHNDTISSVAFSLDAQLLASGSNDNTIKLWDVTTGKLQQTLESHSNAVGCLAFLPNGQLLASGSRDNTIKLWDVTTGKLQQTFEGHSDSIFSIAFSPNGQLLASGSGDNTIKLWDFTAGKLQQTLKDHSDLDSVTFSPDGQVVVSCSRDKTIKLWDVATGKLQQTLEDDPFCVWSEIKVELENQWVCLQGKNVLWLPQESRPVCLAMKDGILALGLAASGKVSFISRFA